MPYYITELDGEWFVVWDTVFSGFSLNNSVHGNFDSYEAAEKYAKRLEKALIR